MTDKPKPFRYDRMFCDPSHGSNGVAASADLPPAKLVGAAEQVEAVTASSAARAPGTAAPLHSSDQSETPAPVEPSNAHADVSADPPVPPPPPPPPPVPLFSHMKPPVLDRTSTQSLALMWEGQRQIGFEGVMPEGQRPPQCPIAYTLQMQQASGERHAALSAA